MWSLRQKRFSMLVKWWCIMAMIGKKGWFNNYHYCRQTEVRQICLFDLYGKYFEGWERFLRRYLEDIIYELSIVHRSSYRRKYFQIRRQIWTLFWGGKGFEVYSTAPSLLELSSSWQTTQTKYVTEWVKKRFTMRDALPNIYSTWVPFGSTWFLLSVYTLLVWESFYQLDATLSYLH